MRVTFAIATLLPALLIGLALIFGRPMSLLALAAMTLIVPLLDHLIRTIDTTEAEEFPANAQLSIVIAIVQLLLLPLVIWRLGSGALDIGEGLAISVSFALWLGQVGNANAHELIHRPARWRHRLGRAAFISLLYGHHVSAHTLIHHRHVGTCADPATARLGQSFYRYVPRAWWGAFRRGHAAERTRLSARFGPRWRRHDPYLIYVGGAALCLVGAAVLGGWSGVALYLMLAASAQAQILMSDYVQHYGLRRHAYAPGHVEPVGPQHSWNAPHACSAAMMLNAPRHSDHHAHPQRPYEALRLSDDMPMLPYSLPVMATLALFPRVWRRIMDNRAALWRKDRPALAA